VLRLAEQRATASLTSHRTAPDRLTGLLLDRETAMAPTSTGSPAGPGSPAPSACFCRADRARGRVTGAGGAPETEGPAQADRRWPASPDGRRGS
jgi:hypothetical protein